MTELPYRPNVGAVLFNRDGRVCVARRADLPNAEGAPGGWQLPQGGIDAGEDPRGAVRRELAEEIGTDRAEIMAEHPEWLTYDLPVELASHIWGGTAGALRARRRGTPAGIGPAGHRVAGDLARHPVRRTLEAGRKTGSSHPDAATVR